ncbi:uncharacterized protein M421DRAFT_103877 [Didymella exigua CBS 183.55]|uniref:Uncharacterized protein n=1 Tax=Didymella exigua CBS 183.55 TaxID=1150837 RepID=A0A6A5R7W0_9PLEO|nr:uncharacterized protein M421DRAFT_103877 [Didymella exigua CBS 183.55]KAF1924255.1 hypothetical protein M421DRAFT_103877 [Didymella exigua CBS 183.55]
MKPQEESKCHNINLVTPVHVVSQVVPFILHARELGRRILIVYNTYSFDSSNNLKLLNGLVVIRPPDSSADKYTATATESIKSIHAKVGNFCFTVGGIAKSGVLVHRLVMSDLDGEGKDLMGWLAENISNNITVHVIDYAGINRPVDPGEVASVRKAAEEADLWRSVEAVKHSSFDI